MKDLKSEGKKETSLEKKNRISLEGSVSTVELSPSLELGDIPLLEDVLDVKKGDYISNELLGESLDSEEITSDDEGIKNAPPKELTEELTAEILDGQSKDQDKRDILASETTSYDNGLNVWKVIEKTENKLLGWEHITKAMTVKRGVIVHVKEAIANNITSTSLYIPNGKLVFENEKWFLR